MPARFVQKTVLLLLVGLLCCPATASGQSNVRLLNVAANTDAPPLYGIYELAFDLSTEYRGEDRFNPAVVDVRAVITRPDGVDEIAYVFFKQEASPQWAVRYAPRVPGRHRLTLEVHTPEGASVHPDALAFSASDALGSGFVTVDPDRPARLRTSDGGQFVMVGVNTAWEDGLPRGGWDMGMVRTFDALQAMGMNFGRVFAGSLWTAYFIEAAGRSVERGLARTYEGAGVYQLDSAARADELFENAQARGLRFAWVLFEHMAFRNQWAVNAYNAANGGPCAEPTDFMSDPVARDYAKRYLRYHYARYGAYTSLGIVELWNETDNGGTSGVPIVWSDTDWALHWHADMAATWRALDIYAHPITTSFAWRDHEAPEDFNRWQTTWPAMPYLTITNQHRYVGSASNAVVDNWLDQIAWMQTSGGGVRPAYIGEYGLGGGETRRFHDPHGYFFHDGAWVPFFFAQAAGTNLIWRVDDLFIPRAPTADGYRAFAAFISPEFAYLRGMDFYPPQPLSDAVTVGRYQGSDRALLFFRDNTADPSEFEVSPQTAPPYVLDGLQDGAYTMEVWDTLAGTFTTAQVTVSEGSVTLDLPPFVRAVAVKVYRSEGSAG